MIELTIKDVKMPANCYVCPISDPACKLWEKMGDSYKMSRHKDCPLREKLYCKDCRFFLEDEECATWHRYVIPEGYCYRAERKEHDKG